MRRRVLLVQPDDSVREVTTLSLERTGGLEVIPVEDAGSALLIAEHIGADAVVLESALPDVPADAAALGLEEAAGAPALFLTGKVMHHERRALEAGTGAPVIRMPYHPLSLAADIAAALDGDVSSDADLGGGHESCLRGWHLPVAARAHDPDSGPTPVEGQAATGPSPRAV